MWISCCGFLFCASTLPEEIIGVKLDKLGCNDLLYKMNHVAMGNAWASGPTSKH